MPDALILQGYLCATGALVVHVQRVFVRDLVDEHLLALSLIEAGLQVRAASRILAAVIKKGLAEVR